MAVRNPGRALAPLQAFDELSPVRHGMSHGLFGGRWPGGAVRDGPFAELGLDAFFRDTPAEPSRRLDRDRGRIVRGGDRALLPRIALAAHVHLVRPQRWPETTKPQDAVGMANSLQGPQSVVFGVPVLSFFATSRVVG